MTQALISVLHPTRRVSPSEAFPQGWQAAFREWISAAPPCDVVTDLSKRWPWADSKVDEICAHDIFEHLADSIHTMNEAHRVLKPGGVLDLIVPTTEGRGAWQDPTHKSWWNANTLFYFCDHWAEWHRFHVAYGITAHFKLVGPLPGPPFAKHEEHASRVWKLHAVLQAVKA